MNETRKSRPALIRNTLLAAAIVSVASAWANDTNRCLVLDGIDDYVSVPDCTELDLPYKAPLSITLWFRFDGVVPTNRAALISFSDAYSVSFLGAADPRLETDFEGPGGLFQTPRLAITADAWFHYAFLYNGTSGFSYVNGTLVTNTSDMGRRWGGRTNFCMGCTSTNHGYLWRGNLDEVSLWSKKITAQELAACLADNISSTAAGLVAWWSFDDDTAADNGPSDLAGVLQAGATTTVASLNDFVRLTAEVRAQELFLQWKRGPADSFYSLQRAWPVTGTWTTISAPMPATSSLSSVSIPLLASNAVYRLAISRQLLLPPPDTTPPGNVIALSATPGDGLVVLLWQNPPDADFAGVRILRKIGGFPTSPTDGAMVFDGIGTNITDTGLVNDTLCYYGAFTYDEVPNYSSGATASATPIAPDTTPPANITGFTATQGNEQVVLVWQNPADVDFAGVKILRKTGSYPQTPTDGSTVHDGTGTNTTDTGLVNGTAYYYTAFCYDEVPNYSSGVTATATPQAPPDTSPPGDVSSLTATPGDGHVVLRWQNPVDVDLAGTRVLRKTGSYPQTPTDGSTVYDGTETNTTDTGLVNGTAYYYTAFCYDEVPNYSGGATVSATPLPPDTTPPMNVSGFIATPGDGQIVLGWQNPADVDFAGVKILRKGGSSPTGPTDGTTVFNGTGTNTTDTGLENGTLYYYKAFSYDEDLNYASGATASATPVAPDTTPPSNVTGFTATPGNGQVVLGWQNPADSDFAGVKILRKVGTFPTSPTDGTTVFNGMGTNTTNTGLVNSTLYYYKAFSYDEVPNYASGVTVAAAPVAPPTNMVLIPAGTFQMGDAMGDVGDPPPHSVYVSAFYVDRYEVTKAKWDEVYTWATNHGYAFRNPGHAKAAAHPVEFLFWSDCVKWCNARSEKEGLTPCYSVGGAVYRNNVSYTPDCNWSATGYRLPTEAEWEKAARGGTAGRRFSWAGSDLIDHSQANYTSAWAAGEPIYSYDRATVSGYHPTYATGSMPYTSPVGSFATNGYGLFDMTGNVQEWCWDFFGPYSADPQVDPRGPTSGGGRCNRGGDWNNYANTCRVASRRSSDPESAGNGLGFRTVRPPAP